MDTRTLSVTFLVFFMIWANADARKIVIFQNTDAEIPVKGRLSIRFLEFPNIEGIGVSVSEDDDLEGRSLIGRVHLNLISSLLIKREILNKANGFLVREEAQGIVFGGDMQGSAPRLTRVNHELDEGLWKLAIPGLPLKDTIHQKGEVLSFGGSSFAFVCNACIEVSKQAEQFLSDPETLEHVQALANDICNILPSDISEKCNETLQAYIQETLEILQDYLSQEKLCISTGLCHENYKDDLELKFSGSSKISSLVVHNDRTCAFCEQFAGEAVNYMSENRTKSEVLSALHLACSKLQGFSAECIVLVDYYAPLFFQEVETVKPEEFCQRINFCSGSSSLSVKPQKNNCAICQSAIDEIKTELKDPEKQIKLIETLLAGCKQIPNYAKECKKLVFEYGPLFLANVEQYLDTNDVCSKIHVCEPSAAPLESNVDVGEPLLELPFSDPSMHATLK